MGRIGREIIEAVVLAVVVFMLLQTTVRNFKVDGSSMDPTLEDGQLLLVNRLLYLQIDLQRLSSIVPFWQVKEQSSRYVMRAPERGEIIVFQYPLDHSKDFVKRVVGLPGEEIEFRNGTVFVDGATLEEPYLAADGGRNGRNGQLLLLKEDEYYVLGDNRGQSNDSRSWGAVTEDELRGRVWMVYWPVPEIQILNILDRIPGFG